MGAPTAIRTNHNNNNNNNNNGEYQPNMKPAAIDNSNSTSNGTETYAVASAALTSCDVYLSLIQQYIGVFQIENALFFAERCIADYPNCYDAIYMQALCHYRLHKYKNARACLNSKHPNTIILQQQQQQQAFGSRATSSSNCNSYSTCCSMLYLSAQCSYELGDYTAAETTLLQTVRTLYQQQHNQHNTNNNSTSMDDWIVQSTPCPIPNGAAGLALLGNICRQSNRNDRAIQYFYMSLQLDPFLFTSFQALAELGETTIDLDASAIFGGSNAVVFKDVTTNKLPTIPSNARENTKTPLQLTLSTPMIPSSNKVNTTANRTGFAAIAPNAASSTARAIGFETPGLTPIAHNTTINDSFYHSRFNNTRNHNIPSHQTFNDRRSSLTPIASGISQQQHMHQSSTNDMSATVMRRAKQIASRQYYPPSPDTSTSAAASTAATPVTSVTRSMRYLRGLGTNNDGMSTKTGANRSLFPTSISENQDSNNPGFMTSSRASNSLYNTVNTINSDHNPKGEGVSTAIKKHAKLEKDDSVQEILNMLTIAGAAYHSLCQYRCTDTIQILQRLQIAQQRTPWVLHQQGRAFLEQGDFMSAQRCFELMHSIDPSRMQGLELLSTVYWQLKKEVDLANLAQRTMDWDFLSPQAHCVAGNCFSLQKDQETALVFFKRSLQLDPNFTYVHTLSGYEYMANEDFGKATSCFRKALQIDDRHYNAWYGLGMIYHRQEKYDLAEYHFERAVNIHPTSGVLRCNLGMAQNANGKAYVALETLSEAFRLDPRNPQARFQRATIYSALHRPEEALAELKVVRDAAPREATVHFAMGKILKRLGRLDEAMKCFLTAMDLDPKDNQMIKSAMDKLGESEGEEEGTANY